MQTRARDLTVLAFDGVALLDIAAPIHVLAAAGRRFNWRSFRIHVAAEGSEITTSSQLKVRTASPLETCPPSEVLIVPSGYGSERKADARLVAWLRERAERAEVVACVGDGALLLAEAGALAGETVSAPPAIHAALAAATPTLVLSHAPTHFGHRLFSARSGTQAALLGLGIAARFFGQKTAAVLAAELELPWISPGAVTGPPDVVIRSLGDGSDGGHGGDDVP